jgi:hypothetical protein
MKTKKKTYLGNCVYAQMTCGQVVLTTENGLAPDNIIFLEPRVLRALSNFLSSRDNEVRPELWTASNRDGV